MNIKIIDLILLMMFVFIQTEQFFLLILLMELLIKKEPKVFLVKLCTAVVMCLSVVHLREN